MQGLLVNLTNPKAIIFIGALVPQFVDPARAQVQQYLLIAVTLCLTDMAGHVVLRHWRLHASVAGCTIRLPFAGRIVCLVVVVSAGALLAISSRPS